MGSANPRVLALNRSVLDRTVLDRSVLDRSLRDYQSNDYSTIQVNNHNDMRYEESPEKSSPMQTPQNAFGPGVLRSLPLKSGTYHNSVKRSVEPLHPRIIPKAQTM